MFCDASYHEYFCCLDEDSRVVTDMVGTGWKYEKAAPRSLGLWWVGVWHIMFLRGLGPREQVPSAGNLDTHLSRRRQAQSSSGCRCSGGWGGDWGMGRLLPGLWCFFLSRYNQGRGSPSFSFLAWQMLPVQFWVLFYPASFSTFIRLPSDTPPLKPSGKHKVQQSTSISVGTTAAES